MPNDLDKLQGTWLLTSLESDGQEMTGGSLGGASIVVKGRSFVSLGMGATYEGAVEIDQTKRPKTFQLLFTAGHAEGTRNPGIYKLENDRWTMCLATRGDRRPRTFATKPGTGFALQTFEREGADRTRAKPANRASGKNRDAKQVNRPGGTNEMAPPLTFEPSSMTGSGAPTTWEGEWEMVAAVFSGAAMSDDMVKWCRRITSANLTAVVAGPQLMLKATFTLDDSKTPHEVDYLNIEGSHARKRQAGIFEFRTGELRICMSAPGQPRPSAFSSKARDGRSFTTWRPIAK